MSPTSCQTAPPRISQTLSIRSVCVQRNRRCARSLRSVPCVVLYFRPRERSTARIRMLACPREAEPANTDQATRSVRADRRKTCVRYAFDRRGIFSPGRRAHLGCRSRSKCRGCATGGQPTVFVGAGKRLAFSPGNAKGAQRAPFGCCQDSSRKQLAQAPVARRHHCMIGLQKMPSTSIAKPFTVSSQRSCGSGLSGWLLLSSGASKYMVRMTRR